MFRNTIPIGRILGIRIGLDYSWFLIFGLLTWTLASGYYPSEFKDWSPMLYWFMGAATAIMLFVSVLLHELGHSIVAMRYKIPVRNITLFIFGGVAQIGSEAPTALAEFWISIAGPVVSFMLGIAFLLIKPVFVNIAPLLALIKYLVYINIMLAAFNLIPGFPLDGGRVFRSIVWGVTHNMRRATIIAGNVGRFIAFLFIFAGVWKVLSGDLVNGLWIAFIGWFLDSAANAQIQQVLIQQMLAGHTVKQAMNQYYATTPSDISLQELLDLHIIGNSRRCFVVEENEKPVGLLTLHHIKDVPAEKRNNVRVDQVMIPMHQIKSVQPDSELQAALEEMDRDGVNQLPVMTNSNVQGMLSRDDVISYLRTLQEFRK